MKRYLYIILGATALLSGCKEDSIMIIPASHSSLNIAKGEFYPNTYPEEYYFNAYFLGVGTSDYNLDIPVRLSGEIDYDNDREFAVAIDPTESKNVSNGEEFSLSETQIFRRGQSEDTIRLKLHIASLNTVDDYKIRLRLCENENFSVGVSKYQYIDITFMKNINTAPPFWLDDSKLKKFPYHPRKGEKFLEISGITDPEWTVSNDKGLLDYWIKTATAWFEANEEFDSETGNRIYFDK